jgi:hypothetical protein
MITIPDNIVFNKELQSYGDFNAHEHKTWNVHRGIISTNRTFHVESSADINKTIRAVVKSSYKIFFMRGFAFAFTFSVEKAPSDILEYGESYLDTRDNSKGTCQWAIIIDETSKIAYPFHI